MDASSNFFSRVGLAISMYASNKESDGQVGEEGGGTGADEQSFSPIRQSDLYPHNSKVVDKGCSPTVQPFPQLKGESIEFLGCFRTEGHIAISNYRFFVSKDNGFHNVPLGLIDGVEMYGSKEQFVVLCKDGGTFCVSFETQTLCHMWQDRLRKAIRGASDLDKTFAFVHWAYTKDQQSDELQHSNSSSPSESLNISKTHILPSLKANRDAIQAEFYRMHMHIDGAWRITDCNSEYRLCATYPKLFVVPAALSEEEIRSAARFRAMGRVPAIVWRHSDNGAVIARSSQPLVGVLGWRNGDDEKLLQAISRSCALTSSRGHAPFRGASNTVPVPYQNCGPPAQRMEDRGQVAQSMLINGHSSGTPDHPVSASQLSHSQATSRLESLVQDSNEVQDNPEACPELLVMDLRSYTAVLGNRAKGGGCECSDYYPNCEIVYNNLPNIHSVRKSFHQLRNVLLSEDPSSYLSNLESTQWLHYLTQLISVACDVVKTVNDRGKPVLVHCSDGWDRTTQIVPLAELMLDPFYRTIEGFQVLIEKEWLGFGHRFSDRCGQYAACADANQRCPVFLQWLDCVHQLLFQFPCYFQFNLNFLVKLGLHSYSCLYGTLMGNCMQERDSVRINERTLSLWSFLNTHNPEVVNHLFTSSGPRVLSPVAHIHKMQLWHTMFTAPTLTPSTGLTSTTAAVGLNESGEYGGGIMAGSEVSGEFEMKEMVLYRNSRSTSNRPLSNSSFASVSSSSPSSPRPPGENAENPSGVTGELGEREGNKGENGACGANNTHEKLSSEALAVVPEAHTSPVSTASDNTAIETGSTPLKTNNVPIVTGSTHGNHMSPIATPTSLPDLSVSPNTRHLTALSTDLLHDAMHDHSPQQHKGISLNGVAHRGKKMASRHAQSNQIVGELELSGSCDNIGLDDDGMISRYSDVDRRLVHILQSYKRRIAGLRQELLKTKAALAACAKEGVGTGDGGGRGEGGRVEEEEAATVGASVAEDNQSPLSLTSWDCVGEGEGVGVRWVPDHAATHCQDCATAFSLIVRKHHCRACGGVFCYSCTDYMCPVPDEQLYNNVRVCSKCYYRLDGHLRTEDSGPT